MNKEECLKENDHMKDSCACLENLEGTNSHGCADHHHGTVLQDRSGSRLLATMGLNLVIPVAQIIGGVMANSVALISDAVHYFSDFKAVLMNATPGYLRIEKVREYLCHLPGILGVHDLHAWQISSAGTAFSCHVVVPDQPVSRTGELAERIKHGLLHRFQIDHPVLEFETRDCGQNALLCALAFNVDNGQTPGEKSRGKSHDGGHDKEKVSRFQTVLYHCLRLLLGAVFLFASYDKILHPQAFAQAVYNYQILPDAAVNLAALILPWLELLLGLCLVAGFWLPGATVLSTGLLTVFIGSLIFNQIRGLDIYCGCFSTETTDGPAGLWIVARDVTFLAIAVYLILKVHFRDVA